MKPSQLLFSKPMMRHWEKRLAQAQGYVRFLRKIHLKPIYFAIPVSLSLGAAGFEAIVLAVLLPLLEGVVRGDYSFVSDLPLLGPLIASVGVLPDSNSIVGILIAIVAIGTFAKVILRYLSGVASAYIARLAYDHVRRLVFKRYLFFGKQFFDLHSTGYLNTVLMVHSRESTKPIEQFQNVLNAVFSLVIYSGLMVYISWQLAVFVLLAFPLMNWLMQRVVQSIRERSVKLSNMINSMSKRTYNILTMIPLVMLYSRQAQEERLFTQISDEAATIEFQIVRYQQLLKPVQELVMLLTVVALIAVMALVSGRGELIAPSSFIVFFYLVINSTTSFAMFHRFRTVLAEAGGPILELKKVLSDHGKYVVPDGTIEFTGLTQALSFRHLSFAYHPDRPILRDVSFSLHAGQTMALVGPTGSGKSTIINLVLRYYDCPAGTLFVDGHDIRTFTLSSWRKKVALVSQDPWLFNDTLRHNITYGLDDVSETRLTRAIEQARLSDYIAGLPHGLETEVGDHGVMLSGGEKQRVSIARALLKQAAVLVLDEATSSLDSKTEALVQAAISEVAHGRTLIVIAHRLATVKRADSIVVLERGQLIEHGSLRELLARRGRFYELWEAQKFT